MEAEKLIKVVEEVYKEMDSQKNLGRLSDYWLGVLDVLWIIKERDGEDLKRLLENFRIECKEDC